MRTPAPIPLNKVFSLRMFVNFSNLANVHMVLAAKLLQTGDHLALKVIQNDAISSSNMERRIVTVAGEETSANFSILSIVPPHSLKSLVTPKSVR